MRAEVLKDWKLEDKFKPKMLSIFGQIFIKKDMRLDLKKGIDFTIAEPLNIAVRIRRHEYYNKYKHEFTIRWSRPSGVTTEYQKIMAGDVGWYFYAFIDIREIDFLDWCIMDMDIFRQTIKQHLLLPKDIRLNKPPDSKLAIYGKQDFPDKFFKAVWPKENYKFIGDRPRLLDYELVIERSKRLFHNKDPIALHALKGILNE